MAAWLKQIGTVADPEHIVLTAGAQHGLTTTFAALLAPGDTILTEELTYSGVRMLCEQMRLKVRGVAMDVEGLRPDALEVACRSSRGRVLYCMPRMQNPTSAVMSERRRRQIAAIAEKYRLIVVEDDTYGFLSPERTSLLPLMPHRTVYVTSLSKSLFPGPRMGCVVAPPSLVDKVATSVWTTMVSSSPLGADLLSSWIEDGTAARIAEWKRHEGAARQMMAKRLLNGERYQTHPNSHHLWLLLPQRWSSDGFVAQARTRGVILNSSSEFAVGEHPPRAVRICLGTPRTRAGLEQALTRVVECLTDRAPSARAVV
jgi:DNA-binding transcriptional MocR family regulator